MLLNQLVQEHHAEGAPVNDNAEPVSGTIAREVSASQLPHASRSLDETTSAGLSSASLATDGQEPAAEVPETGAVAQAQDQEPESQAQLRGKAMQRFLNAQTDVSEEVRRLYQLVCTGFR